MTFFDKINELCSKKGISADKLCKELGLSNATATKWKKGAEPRNSTKKSIANYFNIPIEYLTDETATIPIFFSDTTISVSQDEQNLLNLYRNLNAEGKKKAADYLDDLSQSRKYTVAISETLNNTIPHKLAAFGGENEIIPEDNIEPKIT